ncbi:helix-turn-helix domain-containing protein [Streptomyces meridianus]|uniref:Helix-turn-helix transcriptional regulator n=1 Tax=Streptomyces meridianus TaxID=2938945 RepID=A0ABT0X3X4_9ACTN|nr:helix-turn-helix transcriptional regulator [Streptomyces meridianus]MCM2576362.1 helix-turn-helix transcriptional regulator [Streptomyces meridianus]
MAESRAELSEFLRLRRARLSPEDTPIPFVGGRRRVPGLRREELAQLAGISVDYYTRLEQGKLRNVSESVLDAVAAALQLDDTERTYLRQLAKPPSRRARSARPQRVRPSLTWLLRSMTDSPAYVLGRRTEVIAWNDLASALLAVDLGALPPEQRNMARLVFLDDTARDLWDPWEAKARDIVGGLRMHAGLAPHDAQLVHLVGELSVRSPEFRTMWADHHVWTVPHGRASFRHPQVGQLDLAFEAFAVPDSPEQSLVTYAAEPGTSSAAGLQLLASWTAETVARPVVRTREPDPGD